jgi:hypothetical protein
VSQLARVADIVALAAEIGAVEQDQILGKTRKRPVVRVRQACYLVARDYRYSYPRIGALMQRDHSTVIHGVGVADYLTRRDPVFAAFVAKLRAAAKETQPFVKGQWRGSLPFQAPIISEPSPKPKPPVGPIDYDMQEQRLTADCMRRGSAELLAAIEAAVVAVMAARAGA